MTKILGLLMVCLFVVAVVASALYGDGGIQSDALDMKDNTQTILSNANDDMMDFANGNTDG